MIANQSNKSIYTFVMLRIVLNYRVWAREMSFALQDAGLIRYGNDTVVKPAPYIKSKYDIIGKKKIQKRETYIEK